MQQPPYYDPQQSSNQWPSNPVYPPQQQWTPPPPQYPLPPAKRKRSVPLWLFITTAIVMLFFGAAIGRSGDNSSSNAQSNQPASTPQTANNTPQPTAKPTATPKPLTWKTTHTFTGNGTGKTASFTIAGNDWKLLWSCDPSSFDGDSYNVQADVDNSSDGSPMDFAAVNTICSSSNAKGSTEEHQAGTFYLDVDSEAVWTFKVQELK